MSIWEGYPPKLIVLAQGMRLEALSDAELQLAGLMRMPV